jgi:hypothetical protein
MEIGSSTSLLRHKHEQGASHANNENARYGNQDVLNSFEPCVTAVELEREIGVDAVKLQFNVLITKRTNFLMGG